MVASGSFYLSGNGIPHGTRMALSNYQIRTSAPLDSMKITYQFSRFHAAGFALVDGPLVIIPLWFMPILISVGIGFCWCKTPFLESILHSRLRLLHRVSLLHKAAQTTSSDLIGLGSI